MTKILILIFSILLALNAKAADTWKSPALYDSTNSAHPWTMICDDIGETRIATYFDYYGVQVDKPVKVGDESTSCLGRSGPGCGTIAENGPLQWWGFFVNNYGYTQYTQQSLNHDVCMDDNLLSGLWVCYTEYVAAVPGYLHAPNCKDPGKDWPTWVGPAK